MKGTEHKRRSAKGDRKVHGIDYFYNYISPLDNYKLNNILISVKNMDEVYPNTPTKFKEHFEDLYETLQCYKKSQLKREHLETHTGYKSTSDIGVLIWLAGKSENNFDYVSTLESAQMGDFNSHEAIYFLDNKRVDFIYNLLNYLNKTYNSEKVFYFYNKTNLNFENPDLQHGKIMPVEYLTSPIIPMLIKNGEQELDTFCLACIDEFNAEEFEQLLYMAREMTNDITCKILILFPSWNPSDFSRQVEKAKQTVNVKNNVEVNSYNESFWSLNK